jgi:hypothetical protein
VDINQQADTLKDYLKTQQPEWVVTRNLNLFNDRDVGDKPVISIIVGSGRVMGNGSFAMPTPNDVTVMLLAQQNLRCATNDTSEIEQIELNLRSQLMAAIDSPQLPPDICGTIVKNWSASGQQNKERAEIFFTLSMREF